MSSLRIQRSFSGGAWTEVKSLSLHGFGDASVKGYGACVYLVAHLSNRVVSKLVMSKARVSPIKTVTLPRLELLGALLCARLTKFVMESLRSGIEHKVSYFCWTDSTVALGFIKGEEKMWKPFVQNRV